jgi:hypothetical protein
MAAKKKTKKKKTSLKKTMGKKSAPLKKTAKKAAKVAQKKTSAKAKAKKVVAGKASKQAKKKVQGGTRDLDILEFPASRTGERSGRLAGDLQGVSLDEDADSESVAELEEEGNMFEAGIVAGVEEADNADESEVHTHEVSEDDVPEEYLDQDEK